MLLFPKNMQDAVAILPGLIYCKPEDHSYIMSMMKKGTFMTNSEAYALPIMYYSKSRNMVLDVDQAFYTDNMSQNHNFYKTVENMMNGFIRIGRIAMRLQRIYLSTTSFIKAGSVEEYLQNRGLIPDIVDSSLLKKLDAMYGFTKDETLVEFSEFKELLGYAYSNFMWATRCFLFFVVKKAYRNKMKNGFKRAMEKGAFKWYDVPYFNCVIHNIEQMEELGMEYFDWPIKLKMSFISENPVSDQAVSRDLEDMANAFFFKYVGSASEL